MGAGLVTDPGAVLPDLPVHPHMTLLGRTTPQARSQGGGDAVDVGVLQEDAAHVGVGHAQPGDEDGSNQAPSATRTRRVSSSKAKTSGSTPQTVSEAPTWAASSSSSESPPRRIRPSTSSRLYAGEPRRVAPFIAIQTVSSCSQPASRSLANVCATVVLPDPAEPPTRIRRLPHVAIVSVSTHRLSMSG